MPFKSIIAVASGGVDDATLMAASARLIAQFGALGRVIPAFPDPAADYLAYGASMDPGQASALAERLAISEREAQTRLEERVRQAAQGAGLGASAIIVEKRDLLPAVALTRAAALADLVLFSAEAVSRGGHMRGLFAEALISMRAPILLIKGDFAGVKTAAVAWDGSAQAGRAVRAAIPLLSLAEKVILLTNVEDEALDEDAADAARIRSYLEINGVRNVTAGTAKGDQIAASLMAAAQAENCDLLVAGAYGRPRLQELVLGGSTRALVNAPGRPSLLLAH
jgi:nucleotide-binding universal stress UspA family protein